MTPKQILIVGNNTPQINSFARLLSIDYSTNISICNNYSHAIKHLLEYGIDTLIVWKPFFDENGKDKFFKIICRAKCFDKRIKTIVIDQKPKQRDKYSCQVEGAKFIRWGENNYLRRKLFQALA